MSEPYNFFKRHTLPDDGSAVTLNISGSYFRVIEQTAGKFEMSFDGGNFFEFQKGLKLKFPTDGFKKVWFRILTGTTTANRIAFYYGTAEVDDSRLNVIDESSLATIYTRKLPEFSITPQGSFSGSAVAKGINYLRASDNAKLRSIGWAFKTAAADLKLYYGGDAILPIVANETNEIFVPEESVTAPKEFQFIGGASTGDIYATYWNN